MEAPEKLYYEAHKSLLKLGSPELSISDLRSCAGIKKSNPFTLKLCMASYFINIQQKIRWASRFGRMSKLFPPLIYTGCPKKKLRFVFRGHFRPLNDQKSKKARKQTPPKIQFYLLGGVSRSVLWIYKVSLQHCFHTSTSSAAVPLALSWFDP